MTWGDWPNPSGGTWRKPEPEAPAPRRKRKREWERELEPAESEREELPLVLVARTTTKWVTDAEAEVLTRFGWRVIEDAVELAFYEGSNPRAQGHTTDAQREEEESR